MGEPHRQDGPDPFPELAGLRREAEALTRRLSRAQDTLAEASGRDPSEQVRVTLTTAGRIGMVEVGNSWRVRLDVEGLASAVVAAYREAGRRRMETWAAEVGRTNYLESAAEGDFPPAALASRMEQSVGFGPESASAHEAIRRLWYVLQDAGDALDELAHELESRAQTTVTGHDAGRHVAAVLIGTELTGLDIDPRWLATAQPGQIGVAVTEAVRAGYVVADQLAQGSLTRRWPFDELERLTSDSVRLLRDLGLPCPATPESEDGSL